MKRALQITGALAGTLAIVVAGCAGGGSGGGSSTIPGAPGTPGSKGFGSVKFSIKIPVAQSSAVRKPKYVSANTGSVAFTVNGQSTIVALAPLASNPNCTLSGSSYTCSAVQSNVPAGTDQITVQTYQSTTPTVGTTTPLSEETVTEIIAQNQTNNETFTLNGVATSNLAWTPAATTLTLGTASSINLNVTAEDASGATIIGPGCIVDVNGNALSITDSDTTAHTSATCNSATGAYTLTYDGLAGGASIIPSPTITVSGSGLSTLTQKFTTTSAVSDGDFSLAGTAQNSVGSPWYVCGGKHTSQVPYSPSPAASATAQPVTATAIPSPTATASPYAQLETAVPSGAPSPYPSNGFKTYAMVENALATSPGTPIPTGSPLPWAYKYNVGICQDVTIPAGTPKLYVQVFEGGDDSYLDSDTEADLYATPAPIVTTPRPDYTLINAAPLATLFQEDNCWDSAGWENIFLSSTMLSTATGTVTGTATSRWANCPEIVGSAASAPFGSSYLSLGGYWYYKQISIPAAETNGTFTLFLGSWRNAGSGGAFLTNAAAEYYSYSFWTGAAIY